MTNHDLRGDFLSKIHGFLSTNDDLMYNNRYERDGTFTVSFWFTKEGCTGGIYEYLFSDHQTVDATMWDTPYLDIYVGCETSGGNNDDGFCINDDEFCIKCGEVCIKNDGFCITNDEFCVELGGWSTLDGSIIRYWMRDVTGTEGMMDWPMADAGSFDTVTSMWLHVILVVNPTGIKTYEDGIQVAESQYGYYGSLPLSANAAAPQVMNIPFKK